MNARDIIVFLAGALIGALLIFLISSHEWIGASVRYNFTWDRGWTAVGALSGWAAFLGALVSLPYLIGQWREARLQTRFTIGDAPPTIDVVEHVDDRSQLVIRIVNWNRRALLIHNVKVAPITGVLRLYDVETRDGHEKRGLIPEFEPPIILPGWEDRSKPPLFAQIDVMAREHKDASDGNPEFAPIVPEYPKGAKVIAEVQQLGAKRLRTNLTCDVHL